MGHGRLQDGFVVALQQGLFVGFDRLERWIVGIQSRFNDDVVGVELGVLKQKAYPGIAVHDHAGLLAFRLFQPRYYFEQSGFAGAVFGHESHFLVFVDLQVDVLEEYFFPVGLGHVFQRQVIHGLWIF